MIPIRAAAHLPFSSFMPLRLAVALFLLLPVSLLAQEKARAASAASSMPTYTLCANDRVQVRVFQEDDLTGDYRIGQDGTINFPLVGSIRISGKSSDEASHALADALKRFLKHPQVNIAVIEFSKRRFTVMGQVQKPGTYLLPVEEKLDLLSAIAAAGGFTRMADQSNIVIKRQGGSAGESLEKVNAKLMARPGAPGYVVQVGDQIVVGERVF